ncbi:permease [Paenibacillus xerothermodurans]|uniref:Permease n=1 Tax=Paenibacillus xerothermodurans TaxID=1977292 RepID=A0A2W1NE70_PAEXE|nr:permease [Paenibacillus xerothermodurans]PZE21421.1 permease [Paenibacillus xerothermodurans]
MVQKIESVKNKPGRTLSTNVVLSVTVFLIIAAVGLAYIKWFPYWDKAFVAATEHSIGASIVSGSNPTAPEPSWSAAWEYAVTYYRSVWKAAVLGIVLGALVQVLIPANWLLRVLGKTTFGSTLMGGLFSLPGMMCTCCAAPLAVGLRKKQVSVGAALAFWLGNPTINPATLVFMGFVLSWEFTLLRLVFGLILVFGVSYFANRFGGRTSVPEELEDAPAEEQTAQTTESIWLRWLKSAWTLTLHVVPAYVIAVLVLGAARAWLFPAFSEAQANSLWLIVLLSIAGMLFVIPTAGEIPIIQTLMSFGLGAGPAAALSLTLPAVSLPSLLMISKSFPKRVLIFVAAAVVVLGILSGIVGAWVL